MWINKTKKRLSGDNLFFFYLTLNPKNTRKMTSSKENAQIVTKKKPKLYQKHPQIL